VVRNYLDRMAILPMSTREKATETGTKNARVADD